jgi:heterodisulfide reductase subunit B
MQRNARSYLDSTLVIRDDLGMTLTEIDDWNCCGATEYHSVARLPAYALIGRNLAKAAKQANGTRTVVAGCSACYLNLAKTDHNMALDDKLNEQVNDALAAGGLHYDPGTLKMRHLLDILCNDIGLDAIARRVVRPLKGLRLAPYYGCMVVRPDPEKRFGSQEYPEIMDELLRVLGAEVIDYPVKTHCCGGHMTQISPSVAYELIRRLLYTADNYKADMLVTLCPMCQLNLDAYQADTNRHFQTNYHIPIVYFTQMIGLAFGHEPEELGLGKEFVDPAAALAKIGIELPEEDPVEAKPRRKQRDDPRLPMPQPLPGKEEVK